MIGRFFSNSMTAALIFGVAAAGQNAFGVSISVNTVGAYAPGAAGSPVVNNATSNSAANGIPLAVFQPLVAGAFATNTGGTLNFETSSNWVTSNGGAATGFGDGPTNPITASYGVALSQSLGLWRTDVAAAVPLAIDASGNGANVASGTQIMGIRTSGSPVNLAFSKGLSALGLVFLPRGAARTVTMTAILDDMATIAGSSETINADNTPGSFFWGFKAPAGRTIVGLNILSPGGFSRFDDLGFVVAPEPSSMALIGIGCIAMMVARRRR